MSREVHISQTVKVEHGLRCPRCGGGASGGTRMTYQEMEKPPEFRRGQYVICMYCAALNVYDKPLLRTLTRTERRAFLRSLNHEERERFDLHMRLAQEWIKERTLEVN